MFQARPPRRSSIAHGKKRKKGKKKKKKERKKHIKIFGEEQGNTITSPDVKTSGTSLSERD